MAWADLRPLSHRTMNPLSFLLKDNSLIVSVFYGSPVLLDAKLYTNRWGLNTCGKTGQV